MSSTCVLLSIYGLSLTARLQTELAVTTHTMVSDVHRNILKDLEGADNHQSVSGICTLFHRQMNDRPWLSRFRPAW